MLLTTVINYGIVYLDVDIHEIELPEWIAKCILIKNFIASVIYNLWFGFTECSVKKCNNHFRKI